MVEKKNIQESVDEVKNIPRGQEFTDLYNLYKVIPSDQLSSYVNAFDRKLTASYNGQGKDCYGQGAYLNFTLENASNLIGSWNYGDCVLQVKLLGGFKNFIFFDADRNDFIRNLLIKTYGRALTVEQQLLEITGDANIARRYTTYDASTFGRRYQSAIRREGYNVRGMVYMWNYNHPVALPFNFGDVITCAAATHLRSGASVDEIKRAMRGVMDEKSRKTQSEWFDTVPQMEMLNAARENTPYKRCAADGHIYVPYERKGGGHYNLVKIDEDDVINPKPQFVIPKTVKLDEMPSLPDNEGIFYFSAYGHDWQGIVNYPGADIPAFYLPNEDQWYSFDDFKYGLENVSRGKVAEGILFEAFSPDMTAAEFVAKNGCNVFICAHSDSVKAIFKNGFSRQFANANDYMHNGGALTYGDGQYGSVTFENARDNLSKKRDYAKSDGYKYGSVILKCILLGGWNKFLIFDERLAKIVYKDKWQIPDQINLIVDDEGAKRELTNYANQYSGYELYNPSRDANGRTNHVLYRMFNNKDGFKKWTDFFRKNGIRGAVYHGHGDGYCFVCYNFSEVIPIAATYDDGQTWTSKDFDYEATKERLIAFNDMQQKVGHQYKNVSKFTKKVVCNGKTFGLTVVETKNGRYNFVFNDGKKLSKYDFDSQPAVSTDGWIDFEYRGIQLKGIVDFEGADIPAFYFEPQEQWYSFNDLEEVLNSYSND